MIIKLKQTENYRSYLDDHTGDVIMQCTPDGRLVVCRPTNKSWFDDVWFEVIVRGNAQNRRVDAPHINHKREVVKLLRYTDADVEAHSEANLDGILRDFANADLRDPDGKRSWETQKC